MLLYTLSKKINSIWPFPAIPGEHEVFIFADRRGMDSRFHGNDAGCSFVILLKIGIQTALVLTKIYYSGGPASLKHLDICTKKYYIKYLIQTNKFKI